MDWNWFFSSLAQSSAAIVGIFGAFIITKVLSNQVSYQEKTARAKTLIADASRLKHRAGNLPFDWCVLRTYESAMLRAEDALEDDATLSSEVLYEKARFPRYLPRDTAIKALEALKSKLEQEKAVEHERRFAAAQRAAQSPFRTRVGSAFPTAIGYPLPEKMRKVQLPVEGLESALDSIAELRVEIQHHMRTIEDHLDHVRSNPESSTAITWALGMVASLFLVGVILPLAFMPTPQVWTPSFRMIDLWGVFSFKGALLGSVALLFLTALVVFGYMNWRLKYSPDFVASLQELAEIGHYSRFYVVEDDNKRFVLERAQGQQAKEAAPQSVGSLNV